MPFYPFQMPKDNFYQGFKDHFQSLAWQCMHNPERMGSVLQDSTNAGIDDWQFVCQKHIQNMTFVEHYRESKWP